MKRIESAKLSMSETTTHQEFKEESKKKLEGIVWDILKINFSVGVSI